MKAQAAMHVQLYEFLTLAREVAEWLQPHAPPALFCRKSPRYQLNRSPCGLGLEAVKNKISLTTITCRTNTWHAARRNTCTMGFLGTVTAYGEVSSFLRFWGTCLLHHQDHLPSRHRQQVPLKFRYTFTKIHGVTSKNTIIIWFIEAGSANSECLLFVYIL